MWHYIARRIVLALLVLLMVSIGVFSIVRMLPGDAVILSLDEFSSLTPEALAEARKELGSTARSSTNMAPGSGV